MTGRPTKYSDAVADLIVTLIEGGVPRDHAFRAAGIHPSTGYAWLSRGDNEPDQIDPDDHTRSQLLTMAEQRDADYKKRWNKQQLADAINNTRSPFGEFSDRVRAADSRFMAQAIGKMRETGSDDWRMWDRLLERRFPELRLGYNPNEQLEPGERAGDESDAEARLERAREIRVKMLGTGTDG